MLDDENIFIQIPNYIFWKNRASIYIAGNNYRAAGFATPKEIVGKTDYDCIWYEYADLYREGDAAALDGVIIQNQIEPQLQADGIVRTIMVNKSQLRDKDNQIIGIVGSYTEIIDKSFTGEYQARKRNVPLTEKEANCLVMLVRGYTPKEIADVFKLSIRTIVHRIDNIKKKLNCYSKAELIKKAFTLPFIQNRLLANLFLR